MQLSPLHYQEKDLENLFGSSLLSEPILSLCTISKSWRCQIRPDPYFPFRDRFHDSVLIHGKHGLEKNRIFPYFKQSISVTVNINKTYLITTLFQISQGKVIMYFCVLYTFISKGPISRRKRKMSVKQSNGIPI